MLRRMKGQRVRRRAGASRKMFSGAADRDATAVTGRGERGSSLREDLEEQHSAEDGRGNQKQKPL